MKAAIIICLSVLLASTLFSASTIGIHISPSASIKSRIFLDSASIDLAEANLSKPLNFWISLSKENYLEVAINISKDTYLFEDSPENKSRIGIGVEAGKDISFPIYINDRKTLSPGFSIGCFFKTFLISESDYDFPYNLGFYFSGKLRILPFKSAGPSSIDLGVKYYLPFKNSLYSSPHVVDYSLLFFLGISI